MMLVRDVTFGNEVPEYIWWAFALVDDYGDKINIKFGSSEAAMATLFYMDGVYEY